MELDAEVLRCQVDSLRAALTNVLDAREKEAKAYMSYQVALDNYTSSHSHMVGLKHACAMKDASTAEKEARLLLVSLKIPSGEKK